MVESRCTFSRSMLWRLAAVLVTAVLLATSGVTAAEASDGRSGRPSSLTVMTRNIYVGGDIIRPIIAASGKTGPEALVAFANANHELRRIVDQTDFPTRSRLLAREISRVRPDVIGLQEVALWRHGPLELGQVGVLNATEVDYDFLTILLKALRRQGIRYDLASVQNETDVEAPAFTGSPLDGTIADARDVRLTVRDVILVRHRADLRILDKGGAQYSARINISVAGLPLAIVRGYTFVDVAVRRERVRIIATHLESQSSDLSFAQAGELVAGPAAGADATVVLCDCNSDPLRTGTRPGDHVPYSSAYQRIVAAGFTDQWLSQRRPAPTILTGVLSETVDDDSTASFDRRIDHVFARGSQQTSVQSQRGVLTGARPSDRDRRTGLWPADHAGVAVVLKLR